MPKNSLMPIYIIFGLISTVIGILFIPGLFYFIEYGWCPPGAIIDEFGERQNDFVNMANTMLELRQSYPDDNEIILWRPKYDSQKTNLTLSSGSSVEKILTDDQLLFLCGIAETFANNEYFNRIVADDVEIAFIAEGNLLAIVYSINGVRPTSLLSKNEERRLKIRELDTDWYLLVKR